MARAPITAAPMAAPCTVRQAISSGIVGASAQPIPRERVSAQAQQQHRAAAEAVRQRAPHQLRNAEGQQQRGQRQLRLRHRRAEAFGERRQRGQVQVGGDRLDAQQQ